MRVPIGEPMTGGFRVAPAAAEVISTKLDRIGVRGLEVRKCVAGPSVQGAYSYRCGEKRPGCLSMRP